MRSRISPRFLTVVIVSSIAVVCLSDDDAPRPNKWSPRAISVAARTDAEVIGTRQFNRKAFEIVRSNRFFTDEQFAALSPLVAQQVLEDSRTGSIYIASKDKPNNVYVDIALTYFVQLENPLMAELLDLSGKPITFSAAGETQQAWAVWEFAHRARIVQLPLGVPCEACPLVDRDKLEQVGNTLHLFQNVGKQRRTFARIPLYPFSKKHDAN